MLTPAEQDQADAADAETRRMANLLVDRLGYEPHTGSLAFAQPWFDAIAEAIRTGDAFACTHLDQANIQPIFVGVWRPDLLLCRACYLAGGLLADLAPEETETCDLCRAPHPGRLAPQVFHAGQFMIHSWLCRGCRAAAGIPLNRQERDKP